MGMRTVEYDLHLLGTETEPEAHYLYTDPAAAVIGYNRLALEQRRAAVLTRAGNLPGMEPEVVGSYTPDPDAPPIVHLVAGSGQPWAKVSGRPIMVQMGDPEPAFPREQAAREEAGMSAPHMDITRSMRHAAEWYAIGFIDAVGALSPYDREADPQAFATFHAATAEIQQSVAKSWEIWSAMRREETGK